MHRLKGAEVWIDGDGTVAIKRQDGDYNIYMSINAVSTGNAGTGMQLLSSFPEMKEHVAKVKLQILDAKLKKKGKK